MHLELNQKLELNLALQVPKLPKLKHQKLLPMQFQLQMETPKRRQSKKRHQLVPLRTPLQQMEINKSESQSPREANSSDITV